MMWCILVYWYMEESLEEVQENMVLKRDGRLVVFDSGKVFNAMLSAYSS